VSAAAHGASARIAVNLTWCLPGSVGGSEEYLVRQLLGIPAGSDTAPSLSLFVPPTFSAAHPALTGRYATVVAPDAGVSRVRRIVHESSWLYRQTVGFDLVHHGGGTAPLRTRRPYVLTVHDLQYRRYPQYFSRAKRTYLGAVLPRACRRAVVLTTPSQYVKDSVAEAFDIDPQRIVVVPHGISPAVLGDVTPEADLRQRYQLGDGSIVVYPAVTHPHKNHRFLVRLMRERWCDPQLRLVLCGGVGSAEHDVAAAAAADHRIVRLGRVSDADRNGLLAMAAAMVFPSEYEGFGAPLIEAMALGCPVIASDATCIPGVVGDAALLAPTDLDAWDGLLQQAVDRRGDLIAAGRERAAQFTAESSGAALLRAYELAHGGRSSGFRS
jgi:glycosyltransferase involved in cell wall biosynthesis